MKRSDYCSFLLNPVCFALSLAGPHPAAQVRNEQRWSLCSVPMLQSSTLSLVVAQQPKASCHAGLSYMYMYLDAAYLLTRRKLVSLSSFERELARK